MGLYVLMVQSISIWCSWNTIIKISSIANFHFFNFTKSYWPCFSSFDLDHKRCRYKNQCAKGVAVLAKDVGNLQHEHDYNYKSISSFDCKLKNGPYLIFKFPKMEQLFILWHVRSRD